MKLPPIPSPAQGDLRTWAMKLVAALKAMVREIETPGPKVVQLEHLISVSAATTDGLIMWNPVDGTVVVSKGGQWYNLDIAASPVTITLKGAVRK